MPALGFWAPALAAQLIAYFTLGLLVIPFAMASANPFAMFQTFFCPIPMIATAAPAKLCTSCQDLYATMNEAHADEAHKGTERGHSRVAPLLSWMANLNRGQGGPHLDLFAPSRFRSRTACSLRSDRCPLLCLLAAMNE